MGKETPKSEQNEDAVVTAEDLDLLPIGLEDEAKDDEEIWAELDAEEAAGSDGAAAADELAADDDEDAKAAAAAAKAEEKPKPSKDADDIWADASPAQIAAFEATQAGNTNLQHKLDSEIGRSRTFRRQLSDVTGQLDRAAATPPKKDDDSGSSEAKPENWDKLNTEYPEVAGPVGDRLDVIEANQKKQERRDAAVADDANEDHIATVVEQTRLLAEEHSDWLEIATTPEFDTWLDDQPRRFRDTATRNAKEIVDAKAAGEVITRYKASRSDQGEDLGGPDEDRQETVTSLAEKRARQLETSSGVRSKGPGAAVQGVPEEGTDEEIWDAFDKKDAREAAQA